MSRTKKKDSVGRLVTQDRPPTTIAVDVEVKDMALSFRQALADGRIEHEGKGYHVEVSASINGAALLVTVTPDKDGDASFWRTYAFTSEKLIRAVFDEYLRVPPTAEELSR